MISDIPGTSGPTMTPSRSFPSLRPPGGSGTSGPHASGSGGAGAASGGAAALGLPRRGSSLTNLPRLPPPAAAPPPAPAPAPVPTAIMRPPDDDDDVLNRTVLSESINSEEGSYDDSPEPATMPGSLAAFQRMNAQRRSGSRPALNTPPTQQSIPQEPASRRPTQPGLPATTDVDTIDGPTRPPYEMADLDADQTGPGPMLPPGDSQPLTNRALSASVKVSDPLGAARLSSPGVEISLQDLAALRNRGRPWIPISLFGVILILVGVIGYLLYFYEPPTGFLYVDITQPELRNKARVNISGNELGIPSSWPVLQRIPVGSAMVLVTAEGYQPHAEAVVIKEGQRIATVNATLKPAVEMGKVLISTDPDAAEIKLNGMVVKALNSPGPYFGELPIGIDQRMEVSAQGHSPQVQLLLLKDSGPLKLVVKLEGAAQIAVSSDPTGASILVNGKELGVTPATLKVDQSLQAVTLAKKCYEQQELRLQLPKTPTAEPVPVKGSLRRQPGCQ
jgi:eukaryotic-like serine/threonine-protein kinase